MLQGVAAAQEGQDTHTFDEVVKYLGRGQAPKFKWDQVVPTKPKEEDYCDDDLVYLHKLLGLIQERRSTLAKGVAVALEVARNAKIIANIVQPTKMRLDRQQFTRLRGIASYIVRLNGAALGKAVTSRPVSVIMIDKSDEVIK